MTARTPKHQNQYADTDTKRLLKDEGKVGDLLKPENTPHDHFKLPEDIEKLEREGEIKRHKICHSNGKGEECDRRPTDGVPRFRGKIGSQIEEIATESRGWMDTRNAAR